MIKKAAIALCALIMLTGCKNRHSSYSSYAKEESSENVVHFDYDSSDLSNDTKERLMKHVHLLQNQPSVNLVVEGHCDRRGTREYNLALGERRAHAVKRFITSNLGKTSSHRIETVSYGKERPAVVGEGEEVDRLNRRAVIKEKK